MKAILLLVLIITLLFWEIALGAEVSAVALRSAFESLRHQPQADPSYELHKQGIPLIDKRRVCRSANITSHLRQSTGGRRKDEWSQIF